jgi:peptidoglycan/xylan/chitin deacetylase (PgdA/CDA1 family)
MTQSPTVRLLTEANADAVVTTAATTPGAGLNTALNATILDKIKTDGVPRWKATTAYLAGDKVLSPSGDVVSAKVNFTSGASYNAANWDLSTNVTAKLDKAPAFRDAVPLVAFTFDDSYSQDMTAIKPILDAKGIKGTFCAITGSIGTGGRMSWADLSTLAAAGHEVIPHSRTHADHTTLNQTQLDSEIDGSIQDFKDHGLTPGGYCYPLSASNAAVRAQVRRQVRYGLGATGSVTVNAPPLRTYALGRVSLTQSSDLNALKALVDAAVANKQLLIFLSHSGTELNTSTQMLSDVIDYVKTTAAQIVTVAGALDLVGNVLDVGDYASGSTKYTVLGSNGAFASPDAVSSLGVIGNVNESAASVPSTYAAGKVTYSTVNGANATGWPVATTAANVITDRTNTTNSAYWMQTYVTAAGAMYTRHGTGTDAWGSWLQIATGTPSHTVTATNSPDGNAAPSSYVLGTYITQIGGGTPTGPSGQAGLLITRRGSATDSTWTVQEFHVYRGTASYRRMADTTSTWKAWQQVTT